MNEQIMQAELTPEEAAASLGLSTRLSEQFLMSQAPQLPHQDETEAPEAPQDAELPQGQAEQPKVEEVPQPPKKPQENDNRALLDEMRGMMERMKEEIISELKESKDGQRDS